MSSVSSAPLAQALKGEAIAYTPHGVPTIVRQVDDDTGQARTIVQNEDGTHKVFGANTVASLVGSSDDDARHWLEALRDRELHGLVHEMGKRLVADSQQYAQRRAMLDAIAQRKNWDYFGLQHGAPEKELDKAYKKMARRMHPDKNGGTEEAKRRFQQMKEKYECLKEKYKPPPSEESEGRGGSTRESRSNSEEPEDGGETTRRRRSSDEGDGAESGQDEDNEDADRFGGADEDGEELDAPRRRGSDTSEASPRRRSSETTTPGRREAYDEDEDVSPRRRSSSGQAAQGGRISYDPSDRGSMSETVWRMVRQMRQLQQSLEAVKVELARAH